MRYSRSDLEKIIHARSENLNAQSEHIQLIGKKDINDQFPPDYFDHPP
jgi:hypothetical protein